MTDMFDILFIGGYRYLSIKKDSEVYILLNDLIRFIVLKKLSDEKGKDDTFSAKDYISLRRTLLDKDERYEGYGDLEILKNLGLILYIRFDSYAGVSIFSITDKYRNILKELQNVDEIQLRF